ncbi:MAG: thiamine ABC transporter substrate-binding protein [Anaerolineales bacterium]|nr:thiamine ABC transporter substrate-binding protein [Anaerolineales bacterium]NUQ84904.1 thiamine ABC transporter substrate-binding protein [Anaerolineales bacterium]
MKHITFHLSLSTFHFLFSIFLLAACAPAPAEPQTITIMTHDSFSVSESVVQSFEEANNAKIVFLQSGDAGSVLNRAILTKDTPLADLLFGVDNTFLSRALEADIFEPYASPALAEIPDAFKLDPSNRALPVDYGDVCINYDKKYFEENALSVPQSLEDLTKPEYANLLVVENPATSSPGLAFLLATVAHFGEDYLDYWRALKDNGVVVVDGWETAYYTNFSGSSGRGPQPMVVSYGTSPAAEVIYAETPLDDAPTASIIGPDTCFRQIEFVGILKGTQNRALAEKFVDFMLGGEFQEDVPLQMFVYPVNPNAAFPEEFVKYAQAPAQTAGLSPSEIAADRDRWIQEWTDVVMR